MPAVEESKASGRKFVFWQIYYPTCSEKLNKKPQRISRQVQNKKLVDLSFRC